MRISAVNEVASTFIYLRNSLQTHVLDFILQMQRVIVLLDFNRNSKDSDTSIFFVGMPPFLLYLVRLMIHAYFIQIPARKKAI